jgi:hypothetical protein
MQVQTLDLRIPQGPELSRRSMLDCDATWAIEATLASCVLERKPSLSRMFSTCRLAVRSLMTMLASRCRRNCVVSGRAPVETNHMRWGQRQHRCPRQRVLCVRTPGRSDRILRFRNTAAGRQALSPSDCPWSNALSR